MAVKRFLRKVAGRPCSSPGVKNSIEIALSRTDSEINAFYAEIQDGHQRWWENFIEITLSRTVSEIMCFLCFTQKFKMAT